MLRKSLQEIETTVCRICLDDKSRLILSSNELKDTWEKLTGIELSTQWGMSLMACYMCYAHLQKCAQLRKRSLVAEALLMELVRAGEQVTLNSMESIDRRSNNLHYNYYTSTTESWMCYQSNPGVTNIECKAKLERLDEAMTEELQGNHKNQIEFLHTKEDLYNNKEKYEEQCLDENLYQTVTQTSDEFICHNLQGKLQANSPNISTRDSLFKETIDDQYKNVRCDNVLNKHETIANFWNPKVLLKKLKLFQCKVCSKLSDCETCIKCTHICMRKHTGKRPYVSDIGNHTYIKKYKLNKHIKYKHAVKKKFICDNCQYQCHKKSILITHMRKHTGEKPYICDICNYRFVRKENLRDHIKHKHTLDYMFSCKNCQYQCAYKSKFIRHVRTHTGEKPFRCNFCDSGYALKSRLNEHMKSRHTQEYNFSCKICHFHCLFKSKLIGHMRQHTGEKPFRCDICNTAFSLKGGLKNHIKSMHTRKRKSKY